jgi:hypothetical protein
MLSSHHEAPITVCLMLLLVHIIRGFLKTPEARQSQPLEENSDQFQSVAV